MTVYAVRGFESLFLRKTNFNPDAIGINYASSSVGTGIDDDTICVSDDPELPFYFQEYGEIIDEFVISEELDFIHVYIEVKTDFNESFIQHDIRIELGEVWYVSENWLIEGIMTYNSNN